MSKGVESRGGSIETYVVAKTCKTQAAFFASAGLFISEIKMKNMKCPAYANTGLVMETKAS